MTLQTGDNPNDKEMTPSNIISLFSLIDHESSKITKSRIIINSRSSSINDSEEENEESVDTNGPIMNHSKKNNCWKKTELLTFFDEYENSKDYK